jgi:hypothetical protein
MHEYHTSDREQTPIVADWSTLRICQFDQAGVLVALKDQAHLLAEAANNLLDKRFLLAPAFTTYAAADHFALSVAASYQKNETVKSSLLGTMLEERTCNGEQCFLPFLRVCPSPFAPGPPHWADALAVTEQLFPQATGSINKLKQYDGLFDDGHHRGRMVVNLDGEYVATLFVGGNSLFMRLPPGVLWFLDRSGMSHCLQ